MTITFGPLNTDGYKTFHKDAYAEGITQVYSNFTSRNGRLSNIPTEQSDGKVVFVGLQYFIKDELQSNWNDSFFNIPKEFAIKYIQRHLTAYLGKEYNVSNFEALHDLGYLPIEIKALPEGVSVPYGVPPVTFRNTHPDFAWLTNYLETIFSTQNWPIQTSATTAKQYLRNITNSFKRTGGDMNMIPFMCHDFSFRGMFGKEAAMMSGFGHLAAGNCGTDTIPAIIFAEEYYNANVEKELVGVSVPATEHSTTTSYIMGMVEREGISKLEAEVKYVEYLFDKVPTGILSHVSDSFDFFKFVTEGLPLLKDKILARDGTFVIRPDSGDPVDILCGINSNFKEVDPDYYFGSSFDDWKKAVAEEMDEIFRRNLEATNPHSRETHVWKGEYGVYEVTYEPELNRHDKTYYYVDNWDSTVSYCEFKQIEETPESKGLIELLWNMFGGVETEQGYKLLDSHVGAIYGDSITLERQAEIIKRLEAKGFVPNVVLGVGSYSYQYVTRDTHGSAVKATSVVWDGDQVDVCKDPATDSKKKSAKGLLRVELEDGEYVLYDRQTPEQEEQGELQTVFKDGELLIEHSLEDIRQRVKASI
ncbi:MAG: nicotinate phosphoribosyltransferase [Haliea sp.]|uniref:nicotinate phosphoribosyltransferase n=1 Tax=Haliea sp. TaxID=1932666 RepID=UPI000C4803F4|nr:nicotinate phosphoribosyltransferase [Haliea sp.]MBM68167.1 nicotinate phosphoribosyltransferase [Haliea sp.]MBM68210.1 nicotinate phosphoribosyltransferase [Haliea sp.]|tara:strand:+ start:1519 stop:3285 length:1767 start_codon:yes stop_codon:yes gene_type:complete